MGVWCAYLRQFSEPTLFLGIGKPQRLQKKYFWYIPSKVDLNKELDPKQKTIQIFNIDASGLRKTRNENPLTWEKGVTS